MESFTKFQLLIKPSFQQDSVFNPYFSEKESKGSFEVILDTLSPFGLKAMFKTLVVLLVTYTHQMPSAIYELPSSKEDPLIYHFNLVLLPPSESNHLTLLKVFRQNQRFYLTFVHYDQTPLVSTPIHACSILPFQQVIGFNNYR